MKSSIYADVSRVLTEMEQEGVRAISPDVVTMSVIDSFGVHEQQDARYQDAMVDHVRRTVTSMFNRYKVQAETDDQVDTQLVLPGYERLQQRYLIHEDGQSFAVRTDELTDEQLMVKQAELRNMGAGCFLHADEIQRYIDERSAQAAM